MKESVSCVKEIVSMVVKNLGLHEFQFQLYSS